ncbi:MAG TPA: SpoIIE family protein phosphatase [Anaerolineae bacterium]|nr:SpoIIE family protein phosphatase [Anaerolineae bacterium]
MSTTFEPEKSDPLLGSTTLALRAVFERLSTEDISALRTVSHLKTYPVNTILCHEGETEHTFYVLQAGTVKVTQRIPDGEDRLLAMRGPGEFFGEMAVIDNSPRSASVTAASNVQVIEITQEVFDRVLSHSPELAITLLRHVMQYLRNTMQWQIVELQAKNRALEAAYQQLQAAQAELVATERVKRDLEVAAHLQRSILPDHLPQPIGYHFAARAHPAREIGGDFYDVFKLDEQHLGILLADVSDKSIHAAIFMAVSRTLFLTEARRSLSPRQVVETVNDLLLEISSSDDMFVTAFYGVLHLDDRKLTYVRAGQDKPLLQHADGTYEVLDGLGRFIGMMPALIVEERTIDLQSGDRLILYSDGITDAMDATEQNYGVPRLQKTIWQHRTDSVEKLADAIFSDVVSFEGGAPQFDDITLLVAAID